MDTSDVTVRSELAPSNFLVTPGPGAVLDYDAAVVKARELFQLIAPDRSAEEFLPPAPNPEDIYVEDVEPAPEPEVAVEPVPAAPEPTAPVPTAMEDDGPAQQQQQQQQQPQRPEAAQMDVDDGTIEMAEGDS